VGVSSIDDARALSAKLTVRGARANCTYPSIYTPPAGQDCGCGETVEHAKWSHSVMLLTMFETDGPFSSPFVFEEDSIAALISRFMMTKTCGTNCTTLGTNIPQTQLRKSRKDFFFFLHRVSLSNLKPKFWPKFWHRRASKATSTVMSLMVLAVVTSNQHVYYTCAYIIRMWCWCILYEYSLFVSIPNCISV